MTKRIAFFTDNADPLSPLGGHEAGGENVYILEMSRALGRLGWTVDVFVRWSFRKTSQIAKVSETVRVIRIPAGPIKFIPKEELFPLMPKYIESFLAFKEKNNLDYLLIHGNYYNSAYAAVEAAAKLGIPTVNTFHTLGVVKQKALGSFDPSPADRIEHEKEVLNRLDRIIATSPQMKDDLVNLYAVPAKKIATIGEGVNLKRFYPIPTLIARRVLRWPQNQHIILYIGRIERRKGIDTLVSAIAQLLKKPGIERKNVWCIVSGGEPKSRWKKELPVVKAERERLSKLAEKEGVADVVRFIGGVSPEELPYYYSGADVTCVPSYYEPFGLVPLESMACGTPVVASKVGGLQYTIRDGKTGYLVPAHDATAFADKLLFLLQHPQAKKMMRENGLERVAHSFTWEAVGEKMSAFYNDLLIDFLYKKAFKKPNGNGEGK
ncbi:glycosyltransferase [Candidatus Gottesmanbacteria bacterium]|nr:glycosyltransferase [Candidatus Gottesmanbacteria bacterium]